MNYILLPLSRYQFTDLHNKSTYWIIHKNYALTFSMSRNGELGLNGLKEDLLSLKANSWNKYKQ